MLTKKIERWKFEEIRMVSNSDGKLCSLTRIYERIFRFLPFYSKIDEQLFPADPNKWRAQCKFWVNCILKPVSFKKSK